VAQPLETQFAQIAGVSQMTSTSVVGSSSITIQFVLDRNIDAAANDVQAAINAAGGQLPKNLPSPPTYRKVNPADSPILLLGATSDTLPLTDVDDNVETKLAQQISQISGVAQVLIGGQQKPAIRVQLDPAKLVAKGLSLEDVRIPLSISTVDNPKGQHPRRQACFHDLHQRPAAELERLERCHRRLSQRSAAPRARYRTGGDRTAGHHASRMGGRQARDHSRHLQAARAPTSSTPSTRSTRRCRSCAQRCRRASTCSR
jgi:multidrug efflux pump subunit AcrB